MASRHGESRALGSYARTARINELLREVLADELERFADTDERLRLPTVTGVEVTSGPFEREGLYELGRRNSLRGAF